MTVHFRIDEAKLENNAALIEWYRRFAAECLREAHALAGQRIEGGSGRYERSFEFILQPGSPPTLYFGNSSPIAIYVEEDTRPHVIRPKPPGRRSFTNPNRPGSLRFFDPPGGGEGAAVFSREVHHPGTTGQHIVRDAVSAAADRLRQ